MGMHICENQFANAKRICYKPDLKKVQVGPVLLKETTQL